MNNLAKELGLDEVDEGELTSLIQEHFGFAAEHTPDTVEYGRQGELPALRLIYSKKDKLIAIEDGPGLKESDIQAIVARVNSELRAPSATVIGREITFCSVPVASYYRAPNLQILPPPPQAKRPSVLMAQHPFTLEFPFRASTDFRLNYSRKSRKLQQNVLFLNVVLGGSISTMGNDGHHAWVLVPQDSTNHLSTEWCQEGYLCEGFTAQVDEFSDPGSYSAMIEVDPDDYFNRWGITGDPLEVPSNLSALLLQFWGVSKDIRQQFLRSAFWYRHAFAVYRFARSAAFIALINSIEALLPDEQGAPQCERCGKSLGKSIASRFVELLEEFAPGGGELGSDKRELYAIRSKLSHGGALLRSDEAFENYLHPERTREWHETGFAYRLSRLALINWLGRQPGSETQSIEG